MMKRIELVVLALVVLIGLCYAIVSSIKPHLKKQNDCQAVVDSLSSVNDSLALRIIDLNNEVDLYQLKVDSLRKVKNKVITEYISLYEEIDSANATDLADEFKVVFAKHLGE